MTPGLAAKQTGRHPWRPVTTTAVALAEPRPFTNSRERGEALDVYQNDTIGHDPLSRSASNDPPPFASGRFRGGAR
jgi:hypothetical protein